MGDWTCMWTQGYICVYGWLCVCMSGCTCENLKKQDIMKNKTLNSKMEKLTAVGGGR